MKWEAKLMIHKKESRIGVFFEKNTELIQRIKSIEDARWSQSKQVWHLPDTLVNRERFKVATPLQLSEEKTVQISKFCDWLKSKRYSESTIKTYSEALRSFLLFFNDKPISEITNDDVILYS